MACECFLEAVHESKGNAAGGDRHRMIGIKRICRVIVRERVGGTFKLDQSVSTIDQSSDVAGIANAIDDQDEAVGQGGGRCRLG